MAHKLKLRDLGMDTMERLYYERKEARQKAYAAKKRKKSTMKKEIVSKKARNGQDFDTFDRVLLIQV